MRKSLALILALLASPAMAQTVYTYSSTADEDTAISYAAGLPGACGSVTNSDGSVTQPTPAQFVTCVMAAAFASYGTQSAQASLSSAIAAAGGPAAAASALSAAIVANPVSPAQPAPARQ